MLPALHSCYSRDGLGNRLLNEYKLSQVNGSTAFPLRAQQRLLYYFCGSLDLRYVD